MFPLIQLVVLAILTQSCAPMFMPGRSYRGELPPLTEQETQLKERLFKHVDMLAGVIGQRNMFTPGSLESSVKYLSDTWRAMGYDVQEQTYDIRDTTLKNLVVQINGTKRPQEIVVVGAHYDTPARVPGANDNASGVAAMLEISRMLRESKPARTIRFVAFVNEEPPFFQTRQMGSLVYARACRERRENIAAMITPETIGYYSDQPGSQTFPIPLLKMMYPSTGNYITFVGDIGSAWLVRDCVRSFRSHTKFPSEGGAAPGSITGIGWSDHWSFWQAGYPGIMITDTAPFRYPYYHTPDDTPDKLDYDRLARVVAGLARVTSGLADSNR